MRRWARTCCEMLRDNLLVFAFGVFVTSAGYWTVQVVEGTQDNHVDIAVVMTRLEQIDRRVIETAKSQGAVEKHIADLAYEARKQSETFDALRLELAGRIDRIQKQLGIVLSTRAAVDEMAEEMDELRRDVERMGG